MPSLQITSMKPDIKYKNCAQSLCACFPLIVSSEALIINIRAIENGTLLSPSKTTRSPPFSEKIGSSIK